MMGGNRLRKGVKKNWGGVCIGQSSSYQKQKDQTRVVRSRRKKRKRGGLDRTLSNQFNAAERNRVEGEKEGL